MHINLVSKQFKQPVVIVNVWSLIKTTWESMYLLQKSTALGQYNELFH